MWVEVETPLGDLDESLRERPLMFTAALVFLVGSAGVTSSAADRFQIRIALHEQRVEVVAQLAIRADDVDDTSLRFYLPRELPPTRVDGPKVRGHRFAPDDSFMADTHHLLEVAYDEALDEDEVRLLHVEYSGTLPSAFDGAWLEVFADVGLTPMHETLARSAAYELELALDDPSYRVAAFGDVEGQEGMFRIRAERPVSDVAFVAHPQLRCDTLAEAGFLVEVHHCGADTERVDELAERARWILSHYNDTFGSDEPRDSIRFVVRPTKRDLGYARPGYIVLAQSTLSADGGFGSAVRERGAFQFIAHEIAHLWWMLGDPTGAENWLNESFAEYSSMLALRARFGDEVYEQDVARKRQMSENLPPLRTIERTHPQSHLVFYRKGPWLLHQLQEQLGEGAILDWWALALAEEVRTTDHLLRLLADLEGDEVATEFAAMLEQ